MESEYKFDLRTKAVFCALRTDPGVQNALTAPFRTVLMRAHYFDTPDRRLFRAGISLRTRQENGVSVTCVKYAVPDSPDAPTAGLKCRQELEVNAADLRTAVHALRVRLAPSVAETLEDALPALISVGTLCYTRLTAPLRVPGSETVCALCLDAGTFGDAPFYELELELTSGSLEPLTRFAAALAARYRLSPQIRSKQARAIESAAR